MADSKKSDSKKSDTKVVHRTPKSAKAVIDAAKVVVDSNGKPRAVVALAEALNEHEDKQEYAHNPFGVVVQSPPADEK